MPSTTHRRMIEMQAQLPPLAGFNDRSSTRAGLTIPKRSTTTCKRELSVSAKSTCEGDSSAESVHSDEEPRKSFSADVKPHLSESEIDDDDFFPSDHSEMPSTREPSPEPFWDAAKRYGCRVEDIFPRPIMFPILQQQIPPAYSSSLPLSSHVQRNPTKLSMVDSMASQYAGRKDRVELDVESDVCSLQVSHNSTVSQQAFDQMQQESMKLNRDTTWLRVVHRGYGQVAWRNELWTTKLTFVHGHFAAEGDYFLVSEELSVKTIVDMLTKLNKEIRKLVWFSAIKRANKSRVLFKWEPFIVSPIVHELPVLVDKFSK